MSNTVRNRTDRWILGALVALAMAVIAVLVGGGILKPGSEDTAFVRTSRSNNVDGVRVLYELLHRLGYDLRRSDVPLTRDALRDTDVLLVLDPLHRLNPAELRSLQKWVGEGGVLITSALYVANQTAPVSSQGTPLDAVVTGKPGEGPAGPLSIHVASTPDLPPPREEFADWAERRGDAVVVLYAWQGVPHILSAPAGEGEAIVAADTEFLANGSIGRDDHAVLAANLVRYAQERAGGGRVAFDEYHFGFGAQETGWTLMNGMLLRTSAGWSVLTCAAAGVLFLLYRGRRFGTRRDPQPRTRRSRMEFVHAAAASMDKAGAHRLAFRLNLESWLREQRTRLGLAGAASLDDLATGLAGRSGADPARYARILRDAYAAARDEPSAPSFPSLYRRLAQIESEVAPHERITRARRRTDPN